MDGLELYDRLRPLRDAAADNAYMLGDERERGMYDGYGEVMRRCLELPQADVEDWIYGFTHAIRESGGCGHGIRAGPRDRDGLRHLVPGSDRARTARGYRKTPGSGRPRMSTDGGDHRRRRHRGRPGARGLAGGPRGSKGVPYGVSRLITDAITFSTIL